MSESRWLTEFSDNLCLLMDEECVTQIELSEISGLSKASISDYVNGRKVPNIKSVLKLAYALNCGVDDLIDFGEPID